MNNTIEHLPNGDFKVKYETCVCCFKQTNEPIDKHIDFRNFYVEGVGQLCIECGKKFEDKFIIPIYEQSR